MRSRPRRTRADKVVATSRSWCWGSRCSTEVSSVAGAVTVAASAAAALSATTSAASAIACLNTADLPLGSFRDPSSPGARSTPPFERTPGGERRAGRFPHTRRARSRTFGRRREGHSSGPRGGGVAFPPAPEGARARTARCAEAACAKGVTGVRSNGGLLRAPGSSDLETSQGGGPAVFKHAIALAALVVALSAAAADAATVTARRPRTPRSRTGALAPKLGHWQRPCTARSPPRPAGIEGGNPQRWALLKVPRCPRSRARSRPSEASPLQTLGLSHRSRSASAGGPISWNQSTVTWNTRPTLGAGVRQRSPAIPTRLRIRRVRAAEASAVAPGRACFAITKPSSSGADSSPRTT